MERYNWSAVAEEKMNPLMTRQVIHTPQVSVAQIWLAKGGVVPEHSHINQQVSMVKSGALLFEAAGESVVLNAGDVLVIPPKLPHRFEALEDSTVTDLFTPPREDWIRGEDSYLRR